MNTPAVLADFAPFNRDRGKHRGSRAIHGSRVKVRRGFYMTPGVAARYNPILKAFNQRQFEAGKPKK